MIILYFYLGVVKNAVILSIPTFLSLQLGQKNVCRPYFPSIIEIFLSSNLMNMCDTVTRVHHKYNVSLSF